jgi:hypothetical protein
LEGRTDVGSPNLLEVFPDKPKGMHWRTYDQLRRRHDIAEARSTAGLMRTVDRLQRRMLLRLPSKVERNSTIS